MFCPASSGRVQSFVTASRALFACRVAIAGIPLFIAITALSRLIILQGKDTDPSILLYESGAILLIAIAGFVVSRIRQDEA